MEILQKYYKYITFILNLKNHIDFFIKKDKILKEKAIKNKKMTNWKKIQVLFIVVCKT